LVEKIYRSIMSLYSSMANQRGSYTWWSGFLFC